MQAVATTAAIIPRAREEKNLKFGNDGSYESVDQMLHKLSIKCYARVQKMGLSMEFDDVLQEMRVSYVRARASWNPEGGALFATYCTTSCLNNFNNAIKKMERDRVEIGMVSIEDLIGPGESGDGGTDPYAVMESASCNPIDLPDARLDRAAALQENLACMSLGAKRLIALLLRSDLRSEQGEPAPKLRDLAREAQLEGNELRRVKLEIVKKFGVTWF